MVYTPTIPPSGLDTDGLRKWVEEEFARLARAAGEDADDGTGGGGGGPGSGLGSAWVFETRADVMLATIPPEVKTITVRRYDVGSPLGNASYVRGAGLTANVPLHDATGQLWSIDASITNVLKTSWWGIQQGSVGETDSYSQMQDLANQMGGRSVEVECLVTISHYIKWPSDVNVFGHSLNNTGFIMKNLVPFYEGMMYLNNVSRCVFRHLLFQGNYVQPPNTAAPGASNDMFGAFYISNDIGFPPLQQIEITDCRFTAFKHTRWIKISALNTAGQPFNGMHMINISRNEVWAYTASIVNFAEDGPGYGNLGSIFMHIVGGMGTNEPADISTWQEYPGTVRNFIFEGNKIYGPGLNGVIVGTYNIGNVVIANNVSEGLGNQNQNSEIRDYAYAFYNSSPATVIDPYNITFTGNVVDGGVNCLFYAAGCRHTVIVGNVFRNLIMLPNHVHNLGGNVTLSGLGGYAIGCNGSRGVTVTGNLIENCPGGICVTQDTGYRSADTISGNSIICIQKPWKQTGGIFINPDAAASVAVPSPDRFSNMVISNNSIKMTGAAGDAQTNSTGILIQGTRTIGHTKITGNDIDSDGFGIFGSGPIIGTLELIGNSIHGLLVSAATNIIMPNDPLIVKDLTVDFADSSGSGSGVLLQSCGKLLIDGMTLMNRAAGAPMALNLAASLGVVNNVQFHNVSNLAAAGGLGMVVPTHLAPIGSKVQNFAPVAGGTYWINLTGAAGAWTAQ